MSVFKFIGGLAAKVWGIGKVILPILEAFRSASPDVDQALVKLEDIIQDGGEVADDFLDRNKRTLEDLQDFFQDMQVTGALGEKFMADCLIYSQVDTPDEITPQEVADLGEQLPALKLAIARLFSRNDLETALRDMA